MREEIYIPSAVRPENISPSCRIGGGLCFAQQGARSSRPLCTGGWGVGALKALMVSAVSSPVCFEVPGHKGLSAMSLDDWANFPSRCVLSKRRPSPAGPLHQELHHGIEICLVFSTDAVAANLTVLDAFQVQFINQFIHGQLLREVRLVSEDK